MKRGTGQGRGGSNGSSVVEVVREQASVDTRRVETGHVRVRTRVSAREQLIDEPLLREDVRVERVPVGRIVSERPEVREEGDTLVIPIVEEVPVVEKRLLLRVELRVTRLQRAYRKPQRVSLRATEAIVERIEREPSPGKPRS